MKKTNTAHLRKTPKNTWNFTLRSSNGKILAYGGQGYEKKSEAIRILGKYFWNFEIVEAK